MYSVLGLGLLVENVFELVNSSKLNWSEGEP